MRARQVLELKRRRTELFARATQNIDGRPMQDELLGPLGLAMQPSEYNRLRAAQVAKIDFEVRVVSSRDMHR